MAEFHSVAPVFAVADISATIRWYEEQLGFIGDPFPTHEPYVFAIMYRDKIEIMLRELKATRSLTFIKHATVEFGMRTFGPKE